MFINKQFFNLLIFVKDLKEILNLSNSYKQSVLPRRSSTFFYFLCFLERSFVLGTNEAEKQNKIQILVVAPVFTPHAQYLLTVTGFV